MDCTRDPGRESIVEQRGRCFLIRDGDDRGRLVDSTAQQSPTNDLYATTKVFTGAAPFNSHPSMAATLVIMQGERPPRPTHPALTDELWVLMQRCWHQDPQLRPEMSEVLSILQSPSV